MKTEFNAYLWWDLRNGTNNTGSFDPTIYGWRTYGDEGIMNMINGVTGLYPMFYAEKLLQYFVRPGDTVLGATSDYMLLSAYAARKANGALTLLVINKDATTSFDAQISLSNFAPASTAMTRAYGIAQDDAVRTNNLAPGAQDIATNVVPVGAVFTNSFPPYSLTLFTVTPGPGAIVRTRAATGTIRSAAPGPAGHALPHPEFAGFIHVDSGLDEYAGRKCFECHQCDFTRPGPAILACGVAAVRVVKFAGRLSSWMPSRRRHSRASGESLGQILPVDDPGMIQ